MNRSKIKNILVFVLVVLLFAGSTFAWDFDFQEFQREEAELILIQDYRQYTFDNTAPQITSLSVSSTRVSYTLSEDSTVTIRVLDSGIVERTIRDAVSQLGNRSYIISWNGRDDNGDLLPFGTYTLEIIAVDSAGNQTTATANFTIAAVVVREIGIGFVSFGSGGSSTPATIWPKFRQNAQGAGVSSYRGPQGSEIIWSESGDGGSGDIGITFVREYASPPVIGNEEAIYVAGEDGLFAFAEYGARLWKYSDSTADSFSPIAPVIGDDGTIYTTLSNLTDVGLYAINSDGSLKWKKYYPGIYSSSYMDFSPAMAANNTIYLGARYGLVDESVLLAINEQGQLIWEYPSTGFLEGYIRSCPSVGSDGTIYVGTHFAPSLGEGAGNLYAVNPDGTLKWSLSVEGKIYASPAIAPDGTIYVGTALYGYDSHNSGYDGRLYAINPDGSLKWSTPLDTASGSFLDGAFYDPMAIGTDGTIYVGTTTWGSDTLYAINPDKSLKWRKDNMPGFVGTPAIDSDGILYVNSSGRLYAINSNNGQEEWFAVVPADSHSYPAIGDNKTLYLVGGDHEYSSNISYPAELFAIGLTIAHVSPFHLDENVDVYAPITVNYKKPMGIDTAFPTFSPNILPNGNNYFVDGDFSEVWTGNNTQQTFTHSEKPFAEGETFTFKVTHDEVPATDLISSDVPNPWLFTTGPKITETLPANNATDVAFDDPLIVKYSGYKIDTITYQVWADTNGDGVKENVTDDVGIVAPIWNVDHNEATINHDNFNEGKEIQVRLRTLFDNPYASVSTVPSTFTFTTAVPRITSITPNDGAEEVSLYDPIVVNFDNHKNPQLTWLDISQALNLSDGGHWDLNWISDTQVEFTHTGEPFVEGETYIFKLTNDEAATNPIVSNVPNPFSFTAGPKITETTPSNNATDVIVTDPLIVKYSGYKTDSITLQIWADYDEDGAKEDVTGDLGLVAPLWNVDDDETTLDHNEAIINHDNLKEGMEYEVKLLTSLDNDYPSNDLVNVPSTFTFTTAVTEIIATTPADGATEVTHNTVVPSFTFNTPKDLANFQVTISPVPAGVGISPQAGTLSETFTLSGDFVEGEIYTVEVKALDGTPFTTAVGVANPFTFTTGPKITAVAPSGIVALGEPIVIDYSSAKSTAVADLQIDVAPPITGDDLVWSNGDTKLTINHDPFIEGTEYTVRVKTLNDNDYASDVANPFTFTATVPAAAPLQIISSNPLDGAEEISHNSVAPSFTFSLPNNTDNFYVNISPVVAGIGMSPYPGISDTFTLSGDFVEGETYTIRVTSDFEGNNLIATAEGIANPFEFTTGPKITSVSPVGSSTLTDPIVINYSGAKLTADLQIDVAPPITGYDLVWSDGDTKLTINHDPFIEGTEYTVRVKTLNDNDYASDVANPFTFTATTTPVQPPVAPTGLTITKSVNALDLSWNSVTEATSYKVYRSTKADLTSATEVYAGASNSWTDNNLPAAGSGYYYAVAAVNAGGESGLSANRVGAYSYNLVNGINWLSICLTNSGITNAEELWANIGLLSGDLIEVPDPGLASYTIVYGGDDGMGGIIGSNFTVSHGKCYRITTTAPKVWTLVGGVPNSENNLFNLVTDINWIYLPLSKTGLSSASDLWSDLSMASGDLIEVPDPGLASYTIVYGGDDGMGGIIGTDFTLSTGKAYRITIANPIIWP